MRRLWAPIGAGPPVGGTRSPAQAVVGGPYTLPQRIFVTSTLVSYRSGAYMGTFMFKSISVTLT